MQITGNQVSLDHVNKQGLSPLHYAAALGRLDMMKILIDHGATLPADFNNQTPSPFALLAGKINQQSPFIISKYDIALFLCSMTLWSAQLLPSSMPHPRLLLGLNLASYSPILFNKLSLTPSTLYLRFSFIMSNMDETYKNSPPYQNLNSLLLGAKAQNKIQLIPIPTRVIQAISIRTKAQVKATELIRKKFGKRFPWMNAKEQ